MPILPSPKNINTILKGMRQNITDRTGITNFDRDSKTRALTDALSNEFVEHRTQLINAFESNNLTSAAGKDLDRIGNGLGVPRLETTFAATSSVETNIMFYVQSGSFGAINSGNGFTIPAGRTIATEPNNNELGATVVYDITAPVVCSTAGTVAYTTARARVSGARSNVGSGVLTTHDFSAYTDVLNNTLKVVNLYPILNGRDQESDERYRARIANRYSSLLQTNESKVRLAALTVPGVLNVRMISGYYGIGTVGVVVLGAENQATPSLVRAVQERLNQSKGPGMTATAVAATEASFDFEIDLKPIRTIREADKNKIRANVKQVVSSFISRLGIGETVSFDQLAGEIAQATNNVVSMRGATGKGGLFKAIYVRKGFSNSLLSERQRIVKSSYTLDEEEYPSIGTITISFVE